MPFAIINPIPAKFNPIPAEFCFVVAPFGIVAVFRASIIQNGVASKF